MRNKITALSILAVAGLVSCNPDCRFAPSFSPDQLLSNATAVADFKSRILAKEAVFMREIGYDRETGLAKAFIRLNQRTGMPRLGEEDQEVVQGSTKAEAEHIGVLASSIAGNEDGYVKKEALEIVRRKISSF